MKIFQCNPQISFSGVLNTKNRIYMKVSQSYVHYIRSGMSSKMRCATLVPPTLFRVKQCYNVLKNTISLHKWPKQRFHVMVAVVSAQESGSILKIEFAISKRPYFYSVYLLRVGYFGLNLHSTFKEGLIWRNIFCDQQSQIKIRFAKVSL